MAAAGPLGRLLRVRWRADDSAPAVLDGADADANALVLLHRTAFADVTGTEVTLPEKAKQALLSWAQQHRLGQVAADMARVAARRDRALEQLRRQGLAVRRVHLEPEWRLVSGLGERANAHEIGIHLHGTYGWPALPGSTLKGAAAQWAWENTDLDDPAALGRFTGVFGTPLPEPRAEKVGEHDGDRPGRPRFPESARGRVRFLDALPAASPVTVTVDVLTPHVKPYYDAAADSRAARDVPPPAEHHQPVPVQFLTVSAGRFDAALVGDGERETEQAAWWLAEAVTELGLGAKTGAGYGYLDAEEET
ncbi:type III-B CRISPR module RAMP protein Cmr6 [Thermobifida halotolerans]|uniref:Type III-B CRISPR module RAMP protein Cmr6 n=1 Tax=Thermobifida halotolerans TaxID=483545 RepID=A0AA97LVZ4_9ACTN|nr:type III-B CRISPR module RAMP protein Cmr6 [Thermobifida halotolerans]UOE19089.1 type III-B CRISPR module RAMP protein Cmr6 [Thermobifida halotolerans]